mmetsp:Transcript_12245/g.17559  ORF Transcript_12245/g.17559 Transcript_12245/m.17559 type:complete len:321 (+) Transcript_12245:93-1055(+)
MMIICKISAIMYHFQQRRRQMIRPKPDLIIYSTVMDALANTINYNQESVISNVVDVVLDLLDGMEQQQQEELEIQRRRQQQQRQHRYNQPYQQQKDETLIARIYVSAIKAIANAQEMNSPQVALSILERMKEQQQQRRRSSNYVYHGNDSLLLPTSFGYNHVINSAAISNAETPNDKRLHFQIALKAFQELREGKRIRRTNSNKSVAIPDSFTYAYFIKACCNLLPPSKSRHEIISKALEECTNDGYLSEEVWRRGMAGVSKEEMKEILILLLPNSIEEGYRSMVDMLYLGDLRVTDLPRQWSRNIGGRDGPGGWSFDVE